MRFTSLSQRLLAWFLLVGVMPLVVLGFLLLHNNEQSLRTSALKGLSQLADKKALQIRGYMVERIADTRLIARSQITQEAVVQLARSYRSAHPDSPAYRRVDDRYHGYFQRYVDDKTMFYDVFLIDLQGDVVYSQKHESDFATNLQDGPYRNTGLARAFRDSRMTLESAVSDFERYQPSKAMAAFVAVPVFGAGKLLGVVAFQLDISEIYQAVTDPIGLGASGETVLAKWVDPQHVMIMTPLKYPFEGVLKPVAFDKIPNPMHHALLGMRGNGIETDYHNLQQVAAWRYLPDLRFGMVVKMDADEALASLYQQRIYSLTALLLIILLATGSAYLFGRQLSIPLEKLAQTTDELAKGNLGQRADESAPGELGLFAHTFNRMTENLQTLYRTQERRVEERTAELTQKMAELRIMEAAIASSINAAAIASLDGRIFYVNQAFADLWRLRATEQAIGRFPTEFVDKPEEAQAALAVLQQQGYWRGELRARRKDGTLADLEVSAYLVTDADGKPLCLMASFVNITERKQAEIELQRNRDFLNESQRMGRIGSWELNLASGELRWSDEVYRIFELDPARFTPSYENFLNAIHPDDRSPVDQAYRQSLRDRRQYDVTHRLLVADGCIKWVREYCSSDFDATGKPLRSIGTVQDISEQKLIEDQLRIAATAFETHEAITITDPDDRILRVNKAFETITGYSAEEVVGHTPHMLSSGRHDQAFYAAMWQQITGTGRWEGEIWDRRKNGEVYPKWLTITAVRDESGKVSHYVGISSDISERKLAEEEIYSLAYYDTLTKLPNRRLLNDRFSLALAASQRSGSFGAVLFLDLDRFKMLNDTMGHGYGDLLLVEVAQRIKACAREVDTVARLGGDEFVLVIEEVAADAQDASQKVALIAEKIRAALVQPYHLREHEYHGSPSIGVCLYRGNEESVESLLKHADMAMYQAKDAGRNTVRFFDPLMQQAVEARAELEADLRGALKSRQLQLHYQIQVDDGHRPIGAEALIRWVHPRRGMVSPAQFIPLAEESSLILDIGQWVIETACGQIAEWARDEQMRHLQLAINVSAQQFRMVDFVERLEQVIVRHGISPERLKLELTESVVLEDVADVVVKMHALKGLGVRLSLDDFGTGYSSLAYLKRLPLDQIKIDQSFVQDITTDPNDAVMVKTIIDMAQNFRLNVIAEGVETEAQLAFLRQNNCMAYQGYLFSKPVRLAEFEALARRLYG
jgi:diguanylate cyclase (GGDEF)-like protein/PAS domain S-box-containing protein